MDAERKNKIYERLLKIRIKVEPEATPRPVYVNEKLWELHAYIEEVEQFNIEVTREISILQQAFNNAEVGYQIKKDNLLSNDPVIASLPGSIKDREAKANQALKDDLNSIREYKNELSDLNNLLRSIQLKEKNLNRVNGDIRLQVRVLEAQVKLNATLGTSEAAHSLAAEMAKSRAYAEDLEATDSKEIPTSIADPTSNLDIETILQQGDVPVVNLLSKENPGVVEEAAGSLNTVSTDPATPLNVAEGVATIGIDDVLEGVSVSTENVPAPENPVESLGGVIPFEVKAQPAAAESESTGAVESPPVDVNNLLSTDTGGASESVISIDDLLNDSLVLVSSENKSTMPESKGAGTPEPVEAETKLAIEDDLLKDENSDETPEEKFIRSLPIEEDFNLLSFDPGVVDTGDQKDNPLETMVVDLDQLIDGVSTPSMTPVGASPPVQGSIVEDSATSVAVAEQKVESQPKTIQDSSGISIDDLLDSLPKK